MRFISEKNALVRLQSIKDAFAETIRSEYESRAKSCSTCETPGACCLDVHFVNVRLTRLEAAAINERLVQLSHEHQHAVYERITHTIKKYDLSEGSQQNYACPLFEKGIGCLVHEYGKPLPCIAHACYERKEDLPPDELLTEREIEVDRLNKRVYGSTTLLPLPLSIRRLRPFSDAHRGLSSE
jgi:hypothetical protein